MIYPMTKAQIKYWTAIERCLVDVLDITGSEAQDIMEPHDEDIDAERIKGTSVTECANLVANGFS